MNFGAIAFIVASSQVGSGVIVNSDVFHPYLLSLVLLYVFLSNCVLVSYLLIQIN